MAGLRKKKLTDLAYYEMLGAEALATFETVSDALDEAALGLATEHAVMQNQIDALQLQQATVKEQQAKFSRAALKIRALLD